MHCALLHLKFRKRVYDRADASVESTISSFEELLRDNEDAPTTRRYTQPMLASLRATCQALKEREQTVSATTLVDSGSVKAIERDNAAVAKAVVPVVGPLRFVITARRKSVVRDPTDDVAARPARVVGRSIEQHRGPHSRNYCNRARPTNSGLRSRAAVATSSKSEHLRQIVAQGAGPAPRRCARSTGGGTTPRLY